MPAAVQGEGQAARGSGPQAIAIGSPIDCDDIFATVTLQLGEASFN